MSQKKSRREFLKQLAMLGGGIALAGCEPVVVTVEKVIEKEVVKTVEVEKVITATPSPEEAPMPEVKTVKFMIWGRMLIGNR